VNESEPTVSRRELLRRIGQSAGAALMYQSMSALGFAPESSYAGPVDLGGAPRGASVLVLGAGLAGLVAALELHRAGYKVKVLEYNDRAGGRAWTLRGGDEYTELGGFRQRCEFDPGHYLNPGPWRIPYHHHAMLDYAKRFKVPLEPFTQVNFNAYVHSRRAFGGKPQRFRSLHTDFHGHVAELLGKAVNGGHLDAEVKAEDKEKLLEALRTFGFLDKDYRFRKSELASSGRGFDQPPGGGLAAPPLNSEPLALGELVQSDLWRAFRPSSVYDLAPSLFQPVGGMDRIPMAIYREVAPLVQFGAKVVRIVQDARGVEVTHVDARREGSPRTARADWCVCTIPLSILGQIEMNVSEPMAAAIQAVPYETSVKIGLQFKRRFWEEDEQIYGGHTYTDMPIATIGYPMWDYFSKGKGVLLGAYTFGHAAFIAAAKSPEDRIKDALEQGAVIHPQYKTEFETGVAVAWHRVPWTMGCQGGWTDEARVTHYDNLCALDGRIVLANEHASRLPGWQEGSVLSALDAIGRLHARVVNP
jgi:monoamine oxidase